MLSLKLGKTAVVMLVLAFLTACTHSGTATTTYSGNLGHSADVSDKAKQDKIRASRERARKKRLARREAFAKKRGRNVTQNAKARMEDRSKRTASVSRIKARQKDQKKPTGKRTVKGKVVKVSAAYAGARARNISVSAPWKCVPARLKSVINQISRKFGPVVINSTHRSSGYNRRVGGKKRSYHLRCQAVDFRVRGSTRGLTRWLARHPKVGGFKRYASGFFHIDTGPKRTW